MAERARPILDGLLATRNLSIDSTRKSTPAQTAVSAVVGLNGAKMQPHFTGAAMKYSLVVLLCGLAVLSGAKPLLAQNDLDQRVGKEMDSLVATYKHLHENPELSTEEKESSALVAVELRKLGYDVTDHFGRYDSPGVVSYGIVGVLRNGPGPAVYIRTDMDALPIVENTGLPYASHVRVKRADGAEVGVMHACGHDVHMSVFLGTARILAQLKDRWRGTLVLIGQPAEETVGGASAMLHAGLFTRFPRPDYRSEEH